MSTLTPTTADAPAPLTVRAVERAAGLLAGRRPTRRRFLYRLAVVGSALALDPMRYVLRPTPAYASVCGSGNTCGSGWSVFCCTINRGSNRCPSGSFIAGWWKVDDSAFCLGSPRYYIDCNRKPSARCRCRCNSSGCDRRRVCCNVFRYGQCNTHIGGVTEVVCRLITCTPPWKWANCSRTVRVSNATRSHSARCLPRANPTRIQIKYQDMGMFGSVLGKPTSGERDGVRGGRKRRFERGYILWHRNTGAHEVRGRFAKIYRKWGADRSELGYPRTDLRWVPGRTGWFVRFQRGTIYRRKGAAARVVLKRADKRFRSLGGPRGKLGYPTNSTRRANGAGRVTRFQRGDIYMSPRTDAIEVVGPTLALYRGRQGPDGTGLGFPVQVEHVLAGGGRWQRFEDGVITGPSASRVFIVNDPIFTRYRQEGRMTGPWGFPAGHTAPATATRGLQQRFAKVEVFASPQTGVRWLNGPVLRRYRDEGGPGGGFGFPITDLQRLGDGTQKAEFEGGVIVYDPNTGNTTATPS